MIEVSSLVAMIVAEVMVGLLVLSGLLLLFTLLRKGRIRKAAAHLAERVKTDKVKREERLKALLKDRYQYKDAELEQTLRNMMQTEMLLYQNVINGFLKDDQVHLQQIDVDVENLVLSYQGLDVPESASTPTQGSGGDDIGKLKEENERLSEELRVTMDTMGRMLNEYSTMFAGDEGADQLAGSPASEEPGDSEQIDVSTAEVSQEETKQASMGQPVSAADSMMEDVPLDEVTPELMSNTDIPDMSVDSESEALESADATENASLSEDAAVADEEVSEIIDEVMEIADEMIEDTTQAGLPTETGESLVDDMEKIDIEIPDSDAMTEENDAEATSLEEEWAKLLEEDAENKKQE